jgi:TrpR family transcriptional regulator, trp operon repressor
MVPASPKQLKDLYKLFASIDSVKEAEMLLGDMLTPQELESFCERWQLVQRLHSGKSQRAIADELGISISKVTRGSRALQYGSGGFEYFLGKGQRAQKAQKG